MNCNCNCCNCILPILPCFPHKCVFCATITPDLKSPKLNYSFEQLMNNI